MGFSDEAYDELIRNCRKTRFGMMKKVNRESQGEPFILAILMRKGDQTPSQLAEFSGSSTARISAILGALEKKGQITRRIDQDDRRNILVSLTKQGRERIEVNHREMRESITWVFEQMGEKKTRELTRLVNEFVTYMSLTRPDLPRPTKTQIEDMLEHQHASSPGE